MRILNKLPEDACSSPHLKEKAEGWIPIMFSGTTYYIPVTSEFKKLFKAKRNKDTLSFQTYKQKSSVEPFLRDLLSVMYLQIRDTIGNDIHTTISKKIEEDFSKLFSKQLENNINNEFDKRQLEYRSEN